MGLILLYHRVCELASDPQRLAVSPDRFSKQLAALDSHFRWMELPALIEQAGRRALPSDAVAITFDDGYADNLEHAQPLLERWRTPATVFVATDYIGGDREFWWDDLERLLLTEGCLPRYLRLKIGSDIREWNLDGAADYDAAMCARHASWHVEQRQDPTPRHRVYRELCRRLRSCSRAVRDAVLHELSDQARGTAGPRTTHRVLSANEVRQLNRGSSIHIGAHSASHTALSALPGDEQKLEILSSRSAVERMTGCTPSAFAYPFGTASDYTQATVGHVREAGFSCACLATPGRVGPGTDPLRLPRLIVRDWDPDLFEDRLREWL